MAHENHQGFIEPALIAASAMNPRTAVKLDTIEGQVVPVATKGVEPMGLTGAASAPLGGAVVVYGPGNIVKAVAGASLGANTPIGVASTNGALGPVAGASGSAVWQVGTSRTAAGAGERFSLYVNPRQLSGLA